MSTKPVASKQAIHLTAAPNTASRCHHQSFLERIFQMVLKTVIREILEERFDDSSQPTKARAAVKWIAF